jgi:hypothetical protein
MHHRPQTDTQPRYYGVVLLSANADSHVTAYYHCAQFPWNNMLLKGRRGATCAIQDFRNTVRMFKVPKKSGMQPRPQEAVPVPVGRQHNLPRHISSIFSSAESTKSPPVYCKTCGWYICQKWLILRHPQGQPVETQPANLSTALRPPCSRLKAPAVNSRPRTRATQHPP